MPRSLLAALVALAAGCGDPSVRPPNYPAPETTTHDTWILPTTTTLPPDPSTADFIPSYDHEPGYCDPYQQDCPPDQKCNWYAEGGGTSWNATRCVPLADPPRQLGETCHSRHNGASGLDDCDRGLMCWDTDAENNGVCIALCAGESEHPVCPPGSVCFATGEGLALCIDTCDPLLQDCPPGDGCYLSAGSFFCVVDGSGDEGQTHDPCEYDNACDPGNLCITHAAMECDVYTCCEPLCALSQPNTCPGQGQQCLPVFDEDEVPPEFTDVGVCSLPG